MARINQVGVIAGVAALVIGALATTAAGQQCDNAASAFAASSASASSSSAFQSGSASGSFGGANFSDNRVVNNNSFSSFASSSRRSSQSRAATGPLSGNESFSTPFGASGYSSSMAQQNAAFYRYPLIQKSADVNVRRANRARSDERLAQRRALRAANRPAKATPPTAKNVYRSFADNR